MNWKSYRDLMYDVHTKLIPKIQQRKDITAVFGVPRSGMIPASLVANALHVPLGIAGCADTYQGDRVPARKNKGTVLLIDDSLYKGGALNRAKSYLKSAGENIVTAVVYAQNHNIFTINYYADLVEGPRVFEWNLFGCGITERTMFDIDGVLCFDPSAFDDDGSAYQSCITNAVPYKLPKRKVHALCTSRLERWRKITEEWLKKHNVEYDQLLMHPAENAEKRRKSGNMNQLKAERYKASKAILFVESHDLNARTIAKISQKPVISIESMRLFC